MSASDKQTRHYDTQGYFVEKNLFGEQTLKPIRNIIVKFHQMWLKDNDRLYKQGAINSAYLTTQNYLALDERITLFNFIASPRIQTYLQLLMPDNAMFMNTQLFFNPYDTAQTNYWHRDPQYHLSIVEQKEALAGPKVLHFRVPLENEPGIELILGTHKKWDSETQLDVRLERHQHHKDENLHEGKTIPLSKGDLLVFSGNMIHRGLYGMNRLALDILFCEQSKTFGAFIDPLCLPNTETMSLINNPQIFTRALAATHSN